MNRTDLIASLTGCLFAVGGLVAPAIAQEVEADLILTGGDIKTPDGWAEAMAVRDGIILTIGDEAEVGKHRTDDTEILSLAGATVLPGLHDDHVHPMGSGRMQQQCRFPQGSSADVVLQTIADCASEKADGEWILGGQWDASSIGQEVHKRFLDEVAPDNPVLLNDISMHSTWVNSRALELAGITSETPDPSGGVIERDENGAPTGVLRETAGGLVSRMVPPSTPEQDVAALGWSLDYMLSQGITSFTDAGVGESTLAAYRALEERGALKHRVRACQSWRQMDPSSSDAGPDYAEFHMQRNRFESDLLKADCIKLVLDGVPTDGHTAAMLEPYADVHDHNDPRAKGIVMMPQKLLDEVVTQFDAQGFTVKMHAAGDAAVRAGLDAIAAARDANGFTGNLHNVAHNSFVSMRDINRARSIAAVFEMSPYIWYPNPIIPDIVKAVGPERMKRWTPVKDALDGGALVVPGSDWAVVPSINPWLGIETLITRQVPGGGGETLGAAERITLPQAMEMYTVNSATLMGYRDRIGTLERGMLADMVVIDQNPYKIDVTDIHETQVLMTIIDGEVVYRAPKD